MRIEPVLQMAPPEASAVLSLAFASVMERTTFEQTSQGIPTHVVHFIAANHPRLKPDISPLQNYAAPSGSTV